MKKKSQAGVIVLRSLQESVGNRANTDNAAPLERHNGCIAVSATILLSYNNVIKLIDTASRDRLAFIWVPAILDPRIANPEATFRVRQHLVPFGDCVKKGCP
jgi:hypothetical protein